MEDKFYEWFLKVNKDQDIKEQKKLIIAASYLKLFYLGQLEKLPKDTVFLYDKLEKNIQNSFRGQARIKTTIEICDEILDNNNSSALLLWAKSVRKQGVEKLQVRYVKENYHIEILSGKKNNLSPSGPNSVKLHLKTGELIFGGKKIQGEHTKSVDGIINPKQVNSNSIIYTVQKVTTDDGGNTNSVEEEIIHYIKAAEINTNSIQNSPHWLFLLDGPYWQRKQYKKDRLNRFQKIYQNDNPKVIICTSNTIFQELSQKKLLKEDYRLK